VDKQDDNGPTFAPFAQITEQVLAELNRQDLLREEALPLSRKVIRASANAIRAVHRQQFEESRSLIGSAGQALSRLGEITAACPLFSGVGYVSAAQKEYSEACVTYAVIREEPIPHPDDLGVPVAAYLNGLGEAVGELRRSILDALREDHLGPCEVRLSAMQRIYDFLVTVDYPDALTKGLRRTTDVARRILESTRADLTTALRQTRLQAALERLEKKLPPS
jgi:translin